MITVTELPDFKRHVRKLLQEELCLARFSEDGNDFLFSYERMRMRLSFDPGECSYVWLGRAFQWIKKPAADELATVDRCINEVNYRYKVVHLCRSLKADKDGDYAVMASVSFLVDAPTAISSATLERYLNLIKSGCRLFWDLHKEATKDEVASAKAGEAPPIALRH